MTVDPVCHGSVYALDADQALCHPDNGGVAQPPPVTIPDRLTVKVGDTLVWYSTGDGRAVALEVLP